MSVLAQLEHDLLEAANRRNAANAVATESSVDAPVSRFAVRFRLRRLRLLSIVFACLLASATIALAADGVILSGAPVRPEGRLNPSVGEGIPAPGASQLLSLRVPDPEGGLPWGMRIVRTTRGEVCVQIARVENGQLGELGIDGVFHDDGRFHPLPADVLPETSRVGVRVNDEDATEAVSCHFAGQVVVGEHVGVDRSAGAADGGERKRPLSELRNIYYGMLGAPAVSVSYKAGKTDRSLAVLRPLGAYLIVRRAAHKELEGSGGESLGSEGDLPASAPLTAIAYRLDGKLCQRGPVLPPWGIEHLADPCPEPHWPAARDVAPRDLHHPLHVQLQWANRQVTGAQLSFTAPFAVRSAKEDYVVRIPAISCNRDVAPGQSGVALGYSGWSLGRNVTRGSTVKHRFSSLELFSGQCGGRRHLLDVSRRSAVIEVVYSKYQGAVPVLVGSTTVRLPVGARLVRKPVVQSPRH
ncbi:MAG TPA: hypothetical protein VK691_13140 [Solirubrobacteraceae bacterium]|jgi:hypothetical protein|nr:hypothetical protein [Solirubrobacteraceae bacterium]